MVCPADHLDVLIGAHPLTAVKDLVCSRTEVGENDRIMSPEPQPRLAGETKVSDRVLEHLRGVIHRGEVAPGERLPAERALATQLGVSRITLREALRELQESGYLDIRRGPQGGAYVTQLDQPMEDWRARMMEESGEFDAVMDLRVGLESQAAFLAATRRDDAHLAALEQTIADLDGELDRAAFRQADARFHEGLAQAAGSPRLEEGIRQARGQLFQPYDLLSFEEPVETTRQDHAAILAAVRIGSPEAAAQAMRTHVERTRQQLRQILSGAPG